MKILNISDKNSIHLACEALSKGQLVIYPTETCYGLAADATSGTAITRLLEYKGDRHRQVAIAVPSSSMANQFVELNSLASNLYQQFLPGPITVISNSRHHLDMRLESESGTLGVRIPDHDFALQLIKTYGKPITATSANTSGKKEPYSLADWQKYTISKKQLMVSLFLDGGKLQERPTSTVIDTTLNSPEVLRQGEITLPSSSPSVTTSSPLETQKFASSLVKKHLNLLHKYPLIFALQGELGTGKTQFGKGIAQALAIKDNVSSPTYTLLKEYPYSLPKYSGVYYHIDTWRLSDMTELDHSLHLSTLLKPGNILCLEWAGKAHSYLKKYKELFPIILVDLKEVSPTSRLITHSFSTPQWS